MLLGGSQDGQSICVAISAIIAFASSARNAEIAFQKPDAKPNKFFSFDHALYLHMQQASKDFASLQDSTFVQTHDKFDTNLFFTSRLLKQPSTFQYSKNVSGTRVSSLTLPLAITHHIGLLFALCYQLFRNSFQH